MKTIKRSLIKKYFDEETFLEIRSIVMIPNADNNTKGTMIKGLLTKKEIPFSQLGSGTNRIGILIDGYAVKIALDADGRIDNRREMLYAKNLQPYVVKVYECTEEGDIAVFEYVEIFSKCDIYDPEYVEQMEQILAEITQNYFAGDVGITDKNYVNWGKRTDGSGEICILDFAYIYDVKYNLFTCKCNPDALLQYDKKFVNMTCPLCGEKYTFGQIRRKITRQDQENEIGNICRVGYVLTKSEEELEVVPEFEPGKKDKKKKKKDPNNVKFLIKQHKKKVKDQDDDFDYWEKGSLN